jgi:hypothetical protein
MSVPGRSAQACLGYRTSARHLIGIPRRDTRAFGGGFMCHCVVCFRLLLFANELATAPISTLSLSPHDIGTFPQYLARFYAITYSLAPFKPRSKYAGACTLKPQFCEGHCSSAQPRPPRALCGQGTRSTRSTAQRCTWACVLGHSRGARPIGRAGYVEGRNIDPLGHILGKSTTFRPYLTHFQVFLRADWTPKKPCQFCRCA